MTDIDDDPRRMLDRLLTEKGVDYAQLSASIGRNPAYIQQYIKRGSPRRLGEQDRARIAAYLGVSEALLGGPALHLCAADGRCADGQTHSARAGAGARVGHQRQSALSKLGRSAALGDPARRPGHLDRAQGALGPARDN